MGLDQYAGRFTWRKHARLQHFMADMHKEQNPDIKEYDSSGIPSLGFNSGDKPVIIDEKVIKKLEEAIKTDYHRYFCPDGFFWGQQFQEESMQEYREQDKEFLKECKKALELGEPLTYECSW
tara:strand:- start:88 stop:453 length:366 start_codon:yes stop_codon:yes gene_type:complete